MKSYLSQCLLGLLAVPLTGIASLVMASSYSPYVSTDAPMRLLWGDTHLHTGLSLDARAFGTTLSPGQAYRFARGETITSSRGERVKLSRPLDWLVVTDHSDGLGAMNEVIAGNPRLLSDPRVKDWHQSIRRGGESAFAVTMEVINSVVNGSVPEVFLDKGFAQTIWDDYVTYADQYNVPGSFSAIIGYEWTSAPEGNNLHRNILYRDGAEKAAKVLPFTSMQSDDPQDLWAWMQGYERQTGGEVLAIAHNGNMSNGSMFPLINPETNSPVSAAYASERARWEPVYEVTQIKGDGETHPYLSTRDEFADYETWDKGSFARLKQPHMLQYEYAREALKNGLKLEEKLGVNPYKFGMIGSTDSHTGLATAQENNFFGKHAGLEPDEERWKKSLAKLGDNLNYMGWEQASSGYAAVWAKDNTREAIFDAFKRREVYATTGSRISLRFFAGWEFSAKDAESYSVAESGYRKGVSMGGDLSAAPMGKKPSLLIEAIKDPLSAKLDRVQVVKGWLSATGETHEKVYNVVWSGERELATDGRLAPVGNTVDVKNASWLDSIGEPRLSTVWVDPDFDPKQRAFYYVRVLEIPTPRWTAYDAKRYKQSMHTKVPMITQERAYSSPIWYTP